MNNFSQQLFSTLDGLVTFIDKWTLRTGHAVAWLLVLMVVAQSLIVILRYGFEIGSIALQESVTYLHAACFMLGIAYTVNINGHVRVDIFYRQFIYRFKKYEWFVSSTTVGPFFSQWGQLHFPSGASSSSGSRQHKWNA